MSELLEKDFETDSFLRAVDDNRIFPEIARLLCCSEESVRQRPKDVQTRLVMTYIANWPSTDDDMRRALERVMDLSHDARRETERSERETSAPGSDRQTGFTRELLRRQAERKREEERRAEPPERTGR